MPRLLRLLATVSIVLAGRLAAAATPTCNLNGSGADEVVLTVPAAAASDFDLGWKGKYHDFHVPGGARFEACLTDCDTTTDAVCTVAGYAGGQSAAGRAFTPPIPVAIGTTAACVVTTFREPFATGTANVQTGAIDVDAHVSGDVYLTNLNAVCPVCTGTNAGDAGTCVGGASPGAACTTDEVINVQQATAGNPYRVSRQCLPAGGGAAGPVSVAFALHVTTGTATVSGLCPGQTSANDCGGACGSNNCTGTGNGSLVSQNCCVGSTSKRCFPDPLTRIGTAALPLPAWPDLSYPKTASGTIVAAFCAPGAPGVLGLAVNPDVGLPGPVAFVLPVDESWTLDPTPPATTTTTTLPVGSTTTTTLPGCASAADCADGNPCTDDVCTAGTCSNPTLTGAPGVTCALDDVTTQPACGTLDAKLLGQIQTLTAKAHTTVDQIASAPPKKAKKLRKSAVTTLNKALPKIKKAAKKQTISPACRDALGQAISLLKTAIGSL